MKPGSPGGNRRPGTSTGRWRARHVALWVVALLLSAAAIYANYQRYFAPAQEAAQGQAPGPVVVVTPMVVTPVPAVVATGVVVPSRQVELGFPSGGKVTEIDVSVGDSVLAGQTLARLDIQALQTQETQAEATLQAAQAKLQQVKDSSTPQAVATARAAYDAAAANYQRLTASPSPDQLKADQNAVNQAEAALQAAQSKLQALQAPHSANDVAAALAAVNQAQAAVASAQARLDAAKNPYNSADLAVAQAAVDTAASNLKTAQATLAAIKAGPPAANLAAEQAAVAQAYANLIAVQDEVQAWQNGVTPDPTNTSITVTSNSQAQQLLQSAQAAYNAEVARLNQMTSGPSPSDLQAAQSVVDAAQSSYDAAVAKLNAIKQGPSAADVDSAQKALDRAKSNLASAQASYDQVKAVPANGDVTQAQAAVADATKQLAAARAKLSVDTSGPTAADTAAAANALAKAQSDLDARSGATLAANLALANQGVKQAQAAVNQARLNLKNGTLTAPFDGTVTAVNANVGDQVGTAPIISIVESPGANAVTPTPQP